MFASGIAPSAIFLLLLATVPESPRWLVEQGRLDKARQVLTRIGGPEFADAEMQAINATVAKETENILDFLPRNAVCARPRHRLGSFAADHRHQRLSLLCAGDLQATRIRNRCCAAATVVVGAVMLSFTLIAIWTVDRLGRKPLMLVGTAGMGISLATMGAACSTTWRPVWVWSASWATSPRFALSVGPVVWVILSEIFPNSIRGRAMSLATFALWTANFIVSQTFPMMDEDPWLISRFNHGFPFYFTRHSAPCSWPSCGCGVPETKGRSLEEIETHWMQGPSE